MRSGANVCKSCRSRQASKALFSVLVNYAKIKPRSQYAFDKHCVEDEESNKTIAQDKVPEILLEFGPGKQLPPMTPGSAFPALPCAKAEVAWILISRLDWALSLAAILLPSLFTRRPARWKSDEKDEQDKQCRGASNHRTQFGNLPTLWALHSLYL